jgi:hypothetical protein
VYLPVAGDVVSKKRTERERESMLMGRAAQLIGGAILTLVNIREAKAWQRQSFSL